MKELNENIYTPLLLILITVIFFIPSNNEKWTNLLDSYSYGYQNAYDTSLLSQNTIDYSIPNTPGCPSCTPCICPACPSVLDMNQNNRDYRVLSDPLYPPEQRSDSGTNYINPNMNNGYFRYPTRGYPPPYQLKGYLVDTTNSANIISLFGRPKYPGSTEFQYYVSKKDINNNEIKIDIPNNREIYDQDIVTIKKDIFNGEYKFVALQMEDLVQRPLY